MSEVPFRFHSLSLVKLTVPGAALVLVAILVSTNGVWRAPHRGPAPGVGANPAASNGVGYWEVAADGGVFSFGDAQFYGSMGGQHLNAPIVTMAATPDGKGYWEVAADGGVFSFGDAQFYGSMGGQHLNAPIVTMAAVGATGGAGSGSTAAASGSTSGPPTSPPVTWCETPPTSPYSTAPAGAVTVPPGDNSSFNFSTPNTTYWFAPGTHTLGTSSEGQIDPAYGDTYLGAPGAVLDGQNVNYFAFTGMYNDLANENVTISYLAIEHFAPPQSAGAVNSNGNNGWTETYDTIAYNSPGAGLMLGGNNVVENNCMTENGEYGFQGYSYVNETYGSTFTGGATNITFSDNEVSYNNTQRTTSGIEGGGKFWQDGNVTVEDNYVHNNYDSPGIWLDTNNAGFLIQGNYISNNGNEGLMYEVSYNGLIQDNTFVDNGWTNGPTTAGFPTGAIYISESAGNSAVPSDYAGELMIQKNVFTNNWGGVVVYNNPNRYSGDGQDRGTLTPPPGVNLITWINTDAVANCPSNLAETSPIDYHDLCQWRSENVTVADNTFSFSPSAIGSNCTAANNCGESGLFSSYSSTAAYPGYTPCNNIANNQNDVFKDNTYTGPWTFMYFNQGDVATPAQWQAGIANVQGSGFDFPPQDAGSAMTP
jgi:parallel beta-helix repeat protein